MNWSKREWREATKWFTKKGGGNYTMYELKEEFLRMYSEGILYIPYGDCDNFDPKKGCLGHEVP